MDYLFAIVAIVAVVLIVLRIKTPIRAFEIAVEDHAVFVGRVVMLNSTHGLAGGTKVMLYRDLPDQATMSIPESDGTIGGDVNRIYRELKQTGKDLTCDFQAFGALDSLFCGLPGATPPLKSVLELPADLLGRQRQIADACRYGDRIKIRVHTYRLGRQGRRPKATGVVLHWVELIAREPANRADDA